jgi:hypothetical protein
MNFGAQAVPPTTRMFEAIIVRRSTGSYCESVVALKRSRKGIARGGAKVIDEMGNSP